MHVLRLKQAPFSLLCLLSVCCGVCVLETVPWTPALFVY